MNKMKYIKHNWLAIIVEPKYIKIIMKWIYRGVRGLGFVRITQRGFEGRGEGKVNIHLSIINLSMYSPKFSQESSLCQTCEVQNMQK